MSRRGGAKNAAEALLASEPARKAAAAVLQVVSGLKTPGEASAAIGVNVNRYYVLEGRALAAMVRALEPLPRGRRRKPEAELEALRRERTKAERDASRYQALWRASQKALGLAPPTTKEQGSAAKRSRRPRVRAKTLVAALTATATPAPVAGGT